MITTTIVDRLQQTARINPDKTAYIFLEDGENNEIKLSYAELDIQARRLGAQLQRQHTDITGSRVLLVYPQGLEFIIAFFATLYVGATAVLISPPANPKMAQRLKGIIDDCEVKCVLAPGKVLNAMTMSLTTDSQINTDTLEVGLENHFTQQPISPEQLAFLQYTSGSTGSPKGVIISHANLMANQQAIAYHMQTTPETVAVGWLPMIHDMGLIGNVLHPIYQGSTLIFMTPLHFIRKPLLWLKAISKYRATVSGGPNFAYALCVNKIRPEELTGLDLSCWRVAFNGAEPVHKQTIARFNAAFAVTGLRPESHMAVYGLAEATLIICGTPIDEVIDEVINEVIDTSDEASYVSCGKTLPTDSVKIVDTDTSIEMPDGSEGEIWFSSPSVAQGYWNNKAKTDATFGKKLDDQRHYLRTGDTGFLRDGNVHVTGRLSDMIIVKGKNYHAEDLEWSLSELPGLRSGACAAVAIDDGDTQGVVIIAGSTLSKADDLTALISNIRAAVFQDHQIQLTRVVLVNPKQLPTTTSGKIRRKASRAMLLNNEFKILSDHQLATVNPANRAANFIAATTADELELTALWSVLLDIPAAEIGLDDNFFELGGSSLTMLELSNQLDTSMEHLFRYPTINGFLHRNSEYEFPDVDADLYLPPAALDGKLVGATGITLITGAAGFFGIHFLRSMMQRSEQTFVLLIRGQTEQAISDKFAAAVAYFSMAAEIDLSRIQFLRGDLSQPRLGMTSQDYNWAATQVDTIVHIGSHVNNWLPYEGIRQINVDGTRTLLTLARTGRKKSFHYTSTSTFYPDKPEPSIFLESDDIDRAEINRYFGYEISKYVSETLCKMARDEGLNCNIYRMVWVGGDSKTGRTKANDGFNIMLRVMTTLKVFPEGHYPQDIVPVDLMADTMASLLGKCDNSDFHLTSLSRESISMKRIAAMLSGVGYELSEVSRGEFVARLRDYPLDLWDDHCRSYRQLILRLFADETQQEEAFYVSSNTRQYMDAALLAKMEQPFVDGWFDKMVGFLVRNDAMATISGQSWQQEASNIAAVNQTQHDFGSSGLATLHQLLRTQAAATPDATALRFNGKNISYHQLNRRSDMIAQSLLAKGVRRGEFVGLCLGRSALMISAIFGILKAGGAYLPLDPDYPQQQLDFMLDDCQAQLIITDSISSAKMADHQNNSWLLDETQLIADYASWADGDLAALDVTSESTDLAYVIYTSGSTGQPKGVLVEHRNVVNHNLAVMDIFALSPADRVLQFATINFDAFVEEVFPTLFSGATLVLAAKADVLGLDSFTAIIADNKLSVLNLPTAFWHTLSAVDVATLGVRLVVIGGEQADVGKYNQWRSYNPDVTLINTYGPTETTVSATYCQLSGELTQITIGRPIANSQIHILDDAMQPLPVGFVGQMLIGGAGVCRSYLNRPDIDAQVFTTGPSGERLYHTGDLACWTAAGEIVFKGRADNQVKVRGYRIELEAIESLINAYSTVIDAAVIVTKTEQQQIVGYFTATATDFNINDLREYLAAQLATHARPDLLIPLPVIPLNPNGKIDRQALTAMAVPALPAVDYCAPSSATEKILCEIWQQVLGVKQVGINDNFFALGGHSLMLMQLMALTQQRGLAVTPHQVLGSKTLAVLAQAVDNCAAAQESPYQAPANLITDNCNLITPDMLPLVRLSQADLRHIAVQVPGGMANIADIYPLAPLQQGILFSHQLNPDNDPYILHTLLRVKTQQALDDLLNALQLLIVRHDVLRTGVFWQGLQSPVQVVMREAQLPVNQLAQADDQATALTTLKALPLTMNLNQAPMLLLHVVPLGQDDYIVQLDSHHLASDHIGLAVIYQELAMVEAGLFGQLPPPVYYREFVAHSMHLAEHNHAKPFFTQLLADVDEPTLPFDLIDNRGDGTTLTEYRCQLADVVANKLYARARSLKLSPAVLFHSGWAMVVAACSGRNDVVFGSVMSGRLQGTAGAADLVGLFMNTLPIRVKLAEHTVESLINQVNDRLHQLVPYEQTALAVAQQCSGLSNSTLLFSALLNYRHSAKENDAPTAMADIEIIAELERTNYPFTLSVDDFGDGFVLELQADASINGEQVMGYVQTALINLLDDLTRPLAQLSVLPELERQQWLAHSPVDYPQTQCLHQLFEQQAEQTPDAVAIVCASEQLSYRQLNAQANQLAHYLIDQHQLKADDLVGICVERSLFMLVGILGILKAGGAYVPLDPSYPSARLDYMIADAQPLTVLREPPLMADYPSDNLSLPELTASHLAYVIYTSGSTGQPKGVMIEHRNTVAFLSWALSTFDHQQLSAVCASTSMCFDLSVFEFFAPLSAGGTVYLVENLLVLPQQTFANDITLINTVPSAAEAVLISSTKFAALRTVNLGGELVKQPLVERLYQQGIKRVYDLYGPSESTVYSTYALRQPNGNHTIGKPIDNSQVFILDSSGQLLPAGVAGELHIGGAGLARGYLNRPALTAEKFISSAVCQRLYKTGDLARWQADGSLKYLGRLDHQLKVRGFRIEPGEIEHWLMAQAAIDDAIVMLKGDHLIAYVLSATEDQQQLELLTSQINQHLPDYMLPSACVLLPEWPLTANGKLDRQALPDPRHVATTGPICRPTNRQRKVFV